MTAKIYKVIFTILVLAYATYSHAQVDSTTYKEIVKSLKESQTKFAPDKRTKIVEFGAVNIPLDTYTIQSTEKEALNLLREKLKTKSASITYKTLPDSSVKEKYYGIVKLSVVNLRVSPSHAAEMATQLMLGTQVDILQHERGDYRIRTPEGYIAWVPTSGIEAMDYTEISRWKNTKKIMYTQEFGKSYSEPNTNSLRVSDLVYGNILTLYGDIDGFYQVLYPDGRIAFIPKEEALSFDNWVASRQLTTDNLISSAKTMLGLPYLWGGTSVKGVDCSGFTKTVFYMNGAIIPRDASQQVHAGDKIDILDAGGNFDEQKALQNLKPADLLFFAAGKNSNPNARITHVALYIGNGEFIHAAGSVRINSFLKDKANYDDFQTRSVMAAKRYVGSTDPQIEQISQSKYY